MIFGSKTKPTEEEVAAARAAADAGVDATAEAASSADGTRTKSGPTRKRSAAQAANKRPLVPGDRRAEARNMKERQREQRRASMAGMQAGDERYLPARDKGEQRRYVRDYVDARRNLAEYFLPIAIVFIVFNFIAMNLGQTASFIVLIALYAIVVTSIVDTIVMWQSLKRRLIAKFGTVEKGTMMYASMRAFQLRRARIPKPTSPKHGNFPE